MFSDLDYSFAVQLNLATLATFTFFVISVLQCFPALFHCFANHVLQNLGNTSFTRFQKYKFLCLFHKVLQSFTNESFARFCKYKFCLCDCHRKYYKLGRGQRYMIRVTLFGTLSESENTRETCAILAWQCVFWLTQRAKTCDKIWYLGPLPTTSPKHIQTTVAHLKGNLAVARLAWQFKSLL